MLHSEYRKCGFGIATRENPSETKQKITDKTSLMMTVLPCLGILALAATENADQSQEDFKRGKNANSSTPSAAQYVALICCYHSVKIFPNT